MAPQDVWQDDANCHDVDTIRFYPDHANTAIPRDIQRLCDTCPVQGECLITALRRGESGIWGGTTESHRKAILSRSPRRFCLRCKSPNIFNSKRFVVCLSCGISWAVRSTEEAERLSTG